ncbi:hypothetical protein WJX84_012143 [Apatococcus fuscideae]|uniref:Single-stranded DNA-binding protein n=1 Tax=Apatococcus fuscideae TaxID=2026836 RepID=A0AAW1TD50_9CHLO
MGHKRDVTVGEVDFEAGLRNNIQILGNMGKDVEYKVLATNRLALFTLAIQNKGRDADWVDIEAWGSLAESASQQLGKGTQVAVQGRLKQDKWTDKSGQTRTRLKVVANTINKVRSQSGPRQTDYIGGPSYEQPSTSAPGIDQTYQDRSYQHMDQEWVPEPAPQYSPPQPAQSPRGSSNARAEAEERWKLFFQDRSRWWDNRLTKRNERGPDFKSKDTSDALWLNGAPQWALDELESPDLGGPAF